MLESRMIMNNPCLITETLNWLYLKMSEYIYIWVYYNIIYRTPNSGLFNAGLFNVEGILLFGASFFGYPA